MRNPEIAKLFWICVSMCAIWDVQPGVPLFFQFT